MVGRSSTFLCGDPGEFVIAQYNLSDIIGGGGGDGPSGGGGGNGTILTGCDRIHATLNMTLAGKFFWHFMAPLIRGKIYFSPENAYTTPIMVEVSTTTSSTLLK